MGDEDTTVILEDELGRDVLYEAVDVFELDGQDYIVLVPCDERGGIVIMRLDPDGDTITSIEDDDEFRRVMMHYRPD